MPLGAFYFPVANRDRPLPQSVWTVSAVYALFYIYPAERSCPKISEVILMVSDEFRPDVGKRLFAEHQTELVQALRQLASVLGQDQTHAGLSRFFSNFMRGFWDPYEEVCTVSNRQQGKTTAEILELEKLLKDKLPPDLFSLFSRYGDLLTSRNSAALDYAFLVGYQSAFRFLLMGLSPGATVFQGEENDT